ncbi:hypothetical protein FAES_4017 [Fibrella aestuarina BUZ 2]|uniref:Secreted protein n=1 Tax=Fibrella aestuarina BUZ 2 TaxID=1166018 RepID=I0KD14_9BACT|nr:hypothetical protein [Fibrella aestuarina]CCH02017.1 hypothetical protein FAES_4017 [Fibrella aestuarina BUZ 2]
MKTFLLIASLLLTTPVLAQTIPTRLTNMEMPVKYYDTDTVYRRLEAENMYVEQIDFTGKRAVLALDVYHYLKTKTAAGTDTTITYEKAFAYGSGGRIRYRLEVRNDRYMDVATGRAATDSTAEADRIKEFDFFRLLMQPQAEGGLSMGLEQLIMSRLLLYVSEGAFDTNEYRYR